ncbi:hypothetical protein AVL59_00360 [Streptomyces griseochromogenes]|uniref:Uncharacterized protein n=2 Tax=Streptomyces griseochromogenes TaxID=68214 RepID=A0A1B1ANU8_9ACTN|nr:DUF5819 family protein [Streptomyces griseochromogenes]ANP48224.1 hypothetical protein AVL59_00360 [Streptomyces griseochromogenes]
MDAYDEDSQALRGPDGSAGARRPQDQGDHERPPAREVSGDPHGPVAQERSGDPHGPLAPESPGRPEGPPSQDGYGGPSSRDGSDGPSSRDGYGGPSSRDGYGGPSSRDGYGGPSSRDGSDGPSSQDGSGGPDEPPAPEPPPLPPAPRTGVAALSPRYQVGAAIALAVIAVGACVHLVMVFLSLAPANTVTKQHGKAIEEWVYPEFEQNWKLFAPNPLQQNIAVQVRAEVRMKDGGVRTTGWNDLSARDGAAIDGSLVPSHTQQNELRRAWDFFVSTHGPDNRPVGMRGALSEQYVRRIVVMRLYREDATSREGVIQRVQVRSRTTNVQPPGWSREKISDKPFYRVLPWWTVAADEAAGGVR